MLTDLLIRLRALVRPRAVEQELDEELRFHIDRQVAVYMQAGLSADEATRRVRAEFGGLDQVKDDCRDARGTRSLEDLGQDLRFAARLLAKDRWFTLAAIVALAFCIGASTTAFTVVNAFTRGLPVDAPDRIVRVGARDLDGRPLRLSPREVEEWRAATKTFSGVAAFTQTPNMTVSDERGSPEPFVGAYVSANTFRLLTERPILGRDFLPEDERPGAPSVVILGNSVWRTRYARDPSVVGRTLIINDVPSIVVGVMREGFRFPMVADVWRPLAMMPDFRERLEARVIDAFGRLADKATIPQAQSELEAIAARLAREHPETSRNIGVTVSPYVDSRSVYPFVVALMGAVGLVLLIGCANVANLLLARATHRSHETAIRLSLGATRWRIVRQLLVESTLLAAAAGVLGFGLSVLATRLIANDLAGINFPYWQRWTMDGRVYAFAVVVSLGSAFIFGLVPALHIAKTSMNEALRESGRRSTGGFRIRRWTTGLLAAELAITLVLLAGAGLMMRSFVALYRADLGIDPSRLLMTHLRLPAQAYGAREQRTAFYQRLEERLGAFSAISAFTTASSVPFIGAPRRQVSIDGRPESTRDAQSTVSFVAISSGYFETLGQQLIRGRTFTDVDGISDRESVIVNERFVAMYFSDEDPIGKRIRLATANAPDAAQPAWLTIVGISSSVRHQLTFDLHELDPVAYVPRRPDSPAMWLVVRGESSQASVGSVVREEIWALDPDLALGSIISLEQYMTQSRWPNRIFTGIFASFAWISMILAAVGLYAVTAYAVTQRTQEIGVRIALGARASQVIWLFVRQAIVPLGIGLTIGLAGVLAVGRLLRSFLVQTTPTDPVTLVVVPLLLVSVALAACFLPARHATRLAPVDALRYE